MAEWIWLKLFYATLLSLCVIDKVDYYW